MKSAEEWMKDSQDSYPKSDRKTLAFFSVEEIKAVQADVLRHAARLLGSCHMLEVEADKLSRK